jgi:ferredoxin--NADP+ reductase
VLRSIGYKGEPLDDSLPFDEGRGLIPNEGGRVHDGDGNDVPGLYAVGWIKRGPSGVIGTNKKDAQETADKLFEDLEAEKLPQPELAGDRSAIESLLGERKPDHVTFERWQAIDAAEVERGKPQGRPRVKFCTFEELVEASKAKTAA